MAKPQSLSNRINHRLVIGLAIIFGSLVLAVGLGLVNYLVNEKLHSEILAKAARIQNQAADLNHALLSEVLSTRSYLITGEEESLTNHDLSHQEAQDGLEALKSSLAAVPTLDTADLLALDQLHGSYDTLAAELIAMRQAGQTFEMANLFDSRSDPLVLRILDAEKGLQGELQLWLVQVNQDFTGATRQSILLIPGFLIAGAIAGSLVLRLLLKPPLQTLDAVEQAMAVAAQSQILQPVQLAASDKGSPTTLPLAYNTLANRQAENKASRIQFQEKLAHDMNSILASIQGYAELIAGSHLQAGADLEKIGSVLCRQTLRLGEMIEDAITATRIYEGRLELIYRPVHLGPLLSSLVEEASQQSGRQIIYSDRLEQSLISGDSLRLREAFSKILDNALKFSAPGTPVQVSIGLDGDQNGIEVLVEDRGLGISEGDLPALFQPFGRIRNEHTKGISGNGLSLYIARAIVEAHRGKIKLHSQPGLGTTVVITLPLEGEG
jgi:signal transduction histidine kinase